MPSDNHRRRVWDIRLVDLEGWEALGVLTDQGRELLAELRQQAAYFKERDVDDAVRRMHQDFSAFFPRGPEIRAVIEGEGAWRWLRGQGGVAGVTDDALAAGALKIASAWVTADSGQVEFVILRDPSEELPVPTEALRDLLAAIQELPDAARLLTSSEITLSFRPGT